MKKDREVVAISEDGKFRAFYSHFDMGKKGRLQELREDGWWMTIEYCDDYAQLMRRFHELNLKRKR